MLTRHTLTTLFFALLSLYLFAQPGVGVNTDSIEGQLHITNNSTLGFPQLRLTEEGNDYARIKFENTQYPDSYWDFAGRTGTDTTGVPRLNMFFYNGTVGRDIFLMQGNGSLLRNSFLDNVYDYYYAKNIYRGGMGYDSVDFRIFTTPSTNGKIRIGTKNRNNLVVDALGNVGIGTNPDTLAGELHITTNSVLGFPQLRLTEEGSDYARIKFENTQYLNSYWDFAGLTGTDTTGSPRLNMWFYNGTVGRDVFSMRGNGDLFRNSFKNSVYDYFYTENTYRGGLGIAVEDMRLFTSGSSNGRIRIGTRGGNAIVVDTSGNVGIGVFTPLAKHHVGGDQRVDGKTYVGSVEYIDDGGSNTIQFFGNLIPVVDNLRDLGSSTRRWDDVYATNGVIQTSDRRDKTAIADLDYGLASVLQLRPVSYQWKEQEEQGLKLGLIAQEVLEVIPEVVKTHDLVSTEEGVTSLQELERIGMYYSDLIPVLIKAIQEQNALVESIQAENAELMENQVKILAALREAGIVVK